MKESNIQFFSDSNLSILRLVVDSLPDVVLAINKQGNAIIWNKAAEVLTGFSKEQVLNKGNYEYAIPFYGTPRPLLLDMILGNGLEWESTYDKLEKVNDSLVAQGFANNFNSGKGFYFHSIASPIYGEDGIVLGAIQITRDIGKYKLADHLSFSKVKTSTLSLERLFSILNSSYDVKYKLHAVLNLLLDELHAFRVSLELYVENQKPEVIAMVESGTREPRQDFVPVSDQIDRNDHIQADTHLTDISLDLSTVNEKIGFIKIEGISEIERLPENKSSLLYSLANILAHFLKTSDIHTKRQMKMLTIENIIRINKSLAENNEQNEILDASMKITQECLKTKWIILRLLDPATGELVITNSSGLSEETKLIAARVNPAGTLLGTAIEKRKTVSVEDVTLAPQGLKLPYYSKEMRAIAVAPIFAGGETLGTLKIYSPSPRKWSDDDLSFLTSVAEMIGLALANQRLYMLTRQQSINVISSLSSALESKDVYTKGHSERTTELAMACAEILNMSEMQKEHLWQASIVHDIGKIGVSESILLKPGSLDSFEWMQIIKHPLAGAKIAESGGLSHEVVDAIKYHHENWDGTGYPNKLVADKIPLLARIIRIADAYDAMTSDRPYRGKMDRDEVIKILKIGAGVQFDPIAVEALIQVPESVIK